MQCRTCRVADALPGSRVADALPGSRVADALPGSRVADALPGNRVADALPGSRVATAIPLNCLHARAGYLTQPTKSCNNPASLRAALPVTWSAHLDLHYNDIVCKRGLGLQLGCITPRLS